MSYYNHMHDEKDNIAKCDNCQKKFAWYEYGPFYEGGTDTEIIECPYCKEIYTTIRSNGFVSSREISPDGVFHSGGNTINPQAYLGITGDNTTTLLRPV